MAVIEYQVLVANAPKTGVVGTTLQAGDNPVTLDPDAISLLHRGQAEPENTVLRVTGTGTLTVKAGDSLAIARGLGDLVVAIAGETWIGPLESGRFMRQDGSIVLQGTGLVVTAFLVPRNT